MQHAIPIGTSALFVTLTTISTIIFTAASFQFHPSTTTPISFTKAKCFSQHRNIVCSQLWPGAAGPLSSTKVSLQLQDHVFQLSNQTSDGIACKKQVTRRRQGYNSWSSNHADTRCILQTIEQLASMKEPIPRGERLYQYVMHAKNRLHLENLRRVLQFLNDIFSKNSEAIQDVLSLHPRILRRSVENQLKPTVKFLRDLYGDEMMIAVS